MPGAAVSVVTVSDDHPPDFDLWFGAILTQDVAPSDYELVFVDSGAGAADPAALERAWARTGVDAQHVVVPGAGRAAALNEALRRSSGDLIVFLGDDYVVGPGFVRAHRDFHDRANDETAVGIGPVLLTSAFASPFTEWLERSGALVGVPMYAGMQSVPPEFFFVGNASARRSVLEAAGGFDERFPHNTFDDYEMGLRLRAVGTTAHLVPGATAAHHHAITVRSWCRVVEQTGASARLYEEEHDGPYQWDDVVAASPAAHRLRALWRLARYAVTRGPEERHRYYRRRINAAFAAGHRRAPEGRAAEPAP